MSAFAAKFPGRCAGCSQPYAAGTPIERAERGYVHEACAGALRARAEILAGQTFRSRKPSEWRVGGRRKTRDDRI